MAKYFGKIGYLQTEESVPGVFSEHVEERNYYGDILSNRIKPSEVGEGLNNNLRLDHKISIVSDSFAMNNFGYMKYLIMGGVRWCITNVEIAYPRLILTVGEIYNGPTPTTASST